MARLSDKQRKAMFAKNPKNPNVCTKCKGRGGRKREGEFDVCDACEGFGIILKNTLKGKDVPIFMTSEQTHRLQKGKMSRTELKRLKEAEDKRNPLGFSKKQLAELKGK